jgi:hypothetical protein
MAGDMAKCRAAAAKLEDSTTLAKTAIPTKRSKREPLKANPGLTQVPLVLPLGRAVSTRHHPNVIYWSGSKATMVAAIIAALRSSHDAAFDLIGDLFELAGT